MTATFRSDVSIPTDETPAARCPYCDRPFRGERLCALHLGETHPDDLTAAEREAYERARDEESDELFVYHLKVIAALLLLFFVFSYTYAFVGG